MREVLKKQLNDLSIPFSELKDGNKKELHNIEKQIGKLSSKIPEIENSWVGSWGDDSYNYYTNFIENDEDVCGFDYSTLYNYVVEKSDVNFSNLSDQVNEILKKYKEFSEKIIIELTLLKEIPEFENQIHLYEKIEKFQWGYPPDKFIERRKPKHFLADIDDYQRIMARGLEIPPHISLIANIMSTGSRYVGITQFEKLVDRLFRELDLKLSIDTSIPKLQNYTAELINLFDRFHIIARQLVNRHNNRETLIINDEYDVQDLLLALLKINFEDVRPEEFTPSYAGRRTRMDFLLKRERIVIEVKKTRDSLNDQKIGDELLQDIARYKNHPDCDTLMCFIYDPDGIIKNPRGLEDDLIKESSENLVVEVYIRP